MSPKRRIALLIDADNAEAALMPQIVDVVQKYGDITLRRVYGNWSSAHLSGWKDVLNTFALKPEQQFNHTPGKNATDIALVIDAMDILHTASDVDGFCIVSSDSDFTRLATRIREKNYFMMGIGRSTAPAAFVRAFDKFVYTETLSSSSKVTSTQVPPPAPTLSLAAKRNEDDFEAKFRKALVDAGQDDAWLNLGALGNTLRQSDSKFDHRQFGHASLSQLVDAHPKLFETQKRKTPGGGESIYVRVKQLKKNPKSG